MCSRKIDKLTPLDSLKDQREDDVVKVLKEVKRYNLLYVGGVRGLVQVGINFMFYGCVISVLIKENLDWP